MGAALSSEKLPPSHTAQLPDKPLFVIDARKSGVNLDFKGWWAYRELLFFLTWRDVKVRYKQTFLGVLWVVIQPLVTMLIFTLLFGRLAGLAGRTGGIPYPLFALAGLVPWMFFASALTNSSNSLVISSQLITKIYFPRMIIPAASVAASLIDFALSFVVLAGMMTYYQVGLTLNLLLLPGLIVLLVLLALSVGTFLAALNVKYRDIRQAVPFLVQIWMFASPVIYPTLLVPERWRWVLALNPMTGIIEGFRAALFGRTPIDWKLLAASTAITLVCLVGSAFAFKRMEKGFADVI